MNTYIYQVQLTCVFDRTRESTGTSLLQAFVASSKDQQKHFSRSPTKAKCNGCHYITFGTARSPQLMKAARKFYRSRANKKR